VRGQITFVPLSMKDYLDGRTGDPMVRDVGKNKEADGLKPAPTQRTALSAQRARGCPWSGGGKVSSRWNCAMAERFLAAQADRSLRNEREEEVGPPRSE
jgi:hypothetical protein